MTFELFSRVVSTRDIPDQEVYQGDIATVVELYRDSTGEVIGLEAEVVAANGETLAVASVPADAVRAPTAGDRVVVRAS